MTDDQSVLLVNSPICRICQKVYQNPKILSCLHSFCCGCLDKLQSIQIAQNQLTCPVCDVDTAIPGGGVASLTNNAFLNRISQDYIEAIKSTISKKSLANATSESKWTSPVTARETQYGTGHRDVHKSLDINKETIKLSDDLKKDVSHISEKLQQELMHLQEEALRTTYSIEMVTDTATNWMQRNSEIKTKIHQRSSELQHAIRRHETQMIAQLTNQQYTDKFIHDIETAKCGLRQNLKNIIQAIEFIKQVQEFATEDDVLDMREFLLGNLAILNNVSISYKQYSVDFKNLAETIANDFGQLTLLLSEEVVFDPKQFGEVNNQLEHQDKDDEKNIPKRLKFRRKLNKERRLTSVVDKNWRADEPKQSTEDPLSNLKENLIQRRRNLLQGYGSFEQPDLGTFYGYQNLPKRQMKKQKRKYHSFGGKSALSAAPPDAATLKQINENIQITSKQTSNNVASNEHSLDKQHSFSIETPPDTYSDVKCTAGSESLTSATEEEEWTVITEEVVVQQPPLQGQIDDSTSWQSTPRSDYVTQMSEWTTSNDEDDTISENQLSSERNQNIHPSDAPGSEWIVTVEEVSIPQPINPSPSHKTNSSNFSTDKSDKAQPQDVNEEKNSVPLVTENASKSMTDEQKKLPWHSRYNKIAETATRAVQEERPIHNIGDREHPSPKLETTPNKPSQYISAMDEQLSSDTAEWKVTTEEISIPCDTFTRSSMTQEGRDKRLKFLQNNWRKRKEVLRQTEGFASPTVKEEQISSPIVSGACRDPQTTEKSVHFESNLGLNIRSLLNEEKDKTESKDMVENASRPRLYSETDIEKEVFVDINPSASRLTKYRLNEYRQNMRQKTERWRVSSN
ncbi:uncharacterized protein LOC121384349 [Gigantopelta aegis]|uniref:uncharacterized protein LOC121384349 n=1 Tax=Gigantopelta aegis TaxID=1735272 RepID=UPI001B88D741|nr:uncharacterized protein LOC121384349 [Gigantopelta aegis]